MTIASLRRGEAFVVRRVLLTRELGRRLADMGFVEGASGEVVRKSLLGGPIHVRIKGYDLVLRRSEAAGIEVSGGES